jgi:hypothetical protein
VSEIHPTADELRLIRALAMEAVVWDTGERLAPGSSHSVAAYFRMREAWADLLKTRSVPKPKAEGSTPESPWSKEKPCPWCKSCGQPDKYHAEGSYATGRDGMPCKTFVLWDPPPGTPAEGPDPKSLSHPTPSEDLEAVAGIRAQVEEIDSDPRARRRAYEIPVRVEWLRKILALLPATRPSPPVKGAPAKKGGEA